eukprot:comp21791_c0_seq1/m.48903 comp21791_c0_seq1/g.48903  ORF comp21791_c0_seq1/g.48903 comp21791_c0_seq1/m.48903 type:complete len:405 (+) comp21791_c0_seq1:379-1593(+)
MCLRSSVSSIFCFSVGGYPPWPVVITLRFASVWIVGSRLTWVRPFFMRSARVGNSSRMRGSSTNVASGRPLERCLNVEMSSAGPLRVRCVMKPVSRSVPSRVPKPGLKGLLKLRKLRCASVCSMLLMSLGTWPWYPGRWPVDLGLKSRSKRGVPCNACSISFSFCDFFGGSAFTCSAIVYLRMESRAWFTESRVRSFFLPTMSSLMLLTDFSGWRVRCTVPMACLRASCSGSSRGIVIASERVRGVIALLSNPFMVPMSVSSGGGRVREALRSVQSGYSVGIGGSRLVMVRFEVTDAWSFAVMTIAELADFAAPYWLIAPSLLGSLKYCPSRWSLDMPMCGYATGGWWPSVWVSGFVSWWRDMSPNEFAILNFSPRIVPLYPGMWKRCSSTSVCSGGGSVSDGT